MKVVFADTVYWAALLDNKDQLHLKTLDLSKKLSMVHIVTSEFVLLELLNGFSKDVYLKELVCSFIDAIQDSPLITIVSSSSQLFQSALVRYRKAHDKNWSLVDCASFEIMHVKRITNALTYDHHFEQAGYNALLR